MTISTPRRRRRFDLRALPISIKIVFGLALLLILTAFVTVRLTGTLVTNVQTENELADLEAFSRTQALRIVDMLNQELISLSQLGGQTVIQERLLYYYNYDFVLAAQGEEVYQQDSLLWWQLVDFHETHPEFESVTLLDTRGYIVAMDPRPEDTSMWKEPGGWEWFKVAYGDGSGQPYLFNLNDSALLQTEGVHLAIPIYSELDTGTIIGVMYGVWNLSNATDVVQVGSSREGFVLKGDGTSLFPFSETASLPDDLTYQLRTGQGVEEPGQLLYTPMQGDAWLYGYTKLDELGISDPATVNLDWIVLVGQPLSISQEKTAELIVRLQVLLGSSLALVTLLTLIYSHSLLRPLNKLTEAATRIESGALDTPIPQSPPDEVGKLADILANLMERLLRRVRHLNAAVEASRTALLTLDMNQMLDEITGVLGSKFNYPEARIYLVDPGQRYLRLHSAWGSESERLKRSGYRQAIDETSLIGRAYLLGDVQLGSGRERLREAGLSTEHVEVAIPLQSSERTLGVLYVFGGRHISFMQEDIDILSLLADQVGGAIENARLFEQSAANMAAIEELNRQLTRQAWSEHLTEGDSLRHTLDPEQQWPELDEALRHHDGIKAEVYTDSNHRSVLAAPLILRGESIGTLAVTRPADEKWSQDEIILIETVANRMSMIAESIRLVEESNRTAHREQVVSEVSANLLQRAVKVDNVLQAALDQLSGALGSDHLSLRIGNPPVETGRQITAGGSAAQSDPPPDNGVSGSTAGPLQMGPSTGRPGTNGDGESKDD